MMRVFLVEDHDLVRAGFRSLLERTGQVQVIGEARSAEEALACLAGLECDAVLADLSLPGQDGGYLVSQLSQSRAGLPVMIVSMTFQEQVVLRLLKAGARGYLTKTASPEEFLNALREVCSGGTYLQGSLAARVVRKAGRAEDPVTLSERERQILDLAARGLSNPQVAESLYIAPSTVKTHLQSVFRKLQVEDRTLAVLRAIELGFIEAPKIGM